MYYFKSDKSRIAPPPLDSRFTPEKYRTPWRRDYARLIHSPAFRRLQGKIQLFPGKEGDFFRNRLTHSLEVSQIAQSIAARLNYELRPKYKKYSIEPDVVAFAGLAHDLGHPPFGHFGEEILDEKMINYGGFEGNAQTLRLLATTEKRHFIKGTVLGITKSGCDARIGLNLTFRSLASILKYDRKIPNNKKDRFSFAVKNNVNKNKPLKGYYVSEEAKVKLIKHNVTRGKKYRGDFKTIECRIMDLADDIAYSTYDLEDTFKAGFLTPMDLICAPSKILQNVARKVNKILKVNLSKEDIQNKINTIFNDEFMPPYETKEDTTLSSDDIRDLHFFSLRMANNLSERIAGDAYYRTDFTSKLIGRFIRSVYMDQINHQIPALSSIKVDQSVLVEIEILKNITFEYQIQSPKLRMIAFRSKEIIGTIFKELSSKKGFELLPRDFRIIYETLEPSLDRKRLICDFIAGMTDSYALEFYGRLTSENPQTIFKPL